MIGRAIAHYVVEEQLAEGGMGVVYKARDVLLNRFVVLKALRPDRQPDPERRRRFLQEAQTTSALNHPHIVTIFDVVTDEAGTDYIVMEYLHGRTLDSVIGRTGLSFNESLRYALQVADALAAAHGAGIIHRDLKPANIAVTPTGVVKVLDFGLAKLTERAMAATVVDSTITIASNSTQTADGTVVGTASYMSPEQAEGRHIDARSDIFSFGAVLYEMLSGYRAFTGDTPMLTLTAIIRDQPRPLRELVPSVPRAMEAIVERCLAKRPDRRFQTASELYTALDRLHQDFSSTRLLPVRTLPIVRPNFWLTFVAMLAIVALVSLLYLRPRQDAHDWRVVPATAFAGQEAEPALSPDGNHLAFIWDGDVRGARDLYVKLADSGTPVKLTDTAEPEYAPSWSPDGRRIAFIRPSGNNAGLFVIPALGGQETRVGDFRAGDLVAASRPNWSPDGKWIVVALQRSPDPLAVVNVETGEWEQLTAPPRGTLGDSSPLFAPDGRQLYFVRRRNVWNHAVHVLAVNDDWTLKEEPYAITDWHTAFRGIDWAPNGDSLIASGQVGARYVLMRLPLTLGPVEYLPIENVSGINPAVSRGSGRLVYERALTDVNIWRMPGPASEAEAAPVRVISSTYIDREGSFSPDGKRLAFVSLRSGNYEVWVSNPDGSGQVQLTSMASMRLGSPRWAPDSRHIAFDGYGEGNSDIWVVDTAGGVPKRITDGPSNETRPAWSADGDFIYFTSDSGGARSIWRVRKDGSEPQRLTSTGGIESYGGPDGSSFFYLNGRDIFRQAISGGHPVRVASGAGEGQWCVAGQHVYVRTSDGSRPQVITMYDVQNGSARVFYRFPDDGYPSPGGSSISVSPDEKWVLFAVTERMERDIMLVENFRR